MDLARRFRITMHGAESSLPHCIKIALGCTYLQLSAQVGSFAAHASWVTALSWASCKDDMLLATGCAEGAVRIYAASAAALSALPNAMADPSAEAAVRVMRLLAIVAEPDFRRVACLDLRTQPSRNSGTCI